MRAPAEQGLVLETLTGRDVTPEVVDHVFDFYCSTVDRHFWGRRYLNREFFAEVSARVPDGVMAVLARDAASRRPIAGAWNLVGPRALFGRYWGAKEERPFLHFNVCYYHGIAECIARGIPLFEPGAGGEHKLARGFEPAITESAHLLRDGRLDHAVRDSLGREARAIAGHVEEYARDPILRGPARPAASRESGPRGLDRG